MDLNTTEEQHVEAIKNAWSKYGLSVIGGFVLFVASYYGWNEYQAYKQNKNALASDAYEAAIETINEPEAFLKAVNEFEKTHDHEAYRSFLHLRAAKTLFAEKKWEEGKAMLNGLIDSDLKGISEVAAARLVRVHIELKEYDAALSQLDLITGDAFESLKQELRGDIYERQGEKKLAQQAYQAALSASKEKNELLQMKADNVATLP